MSSSAIVQPSRSAYFTDTAFERVYLVNGLARSGNHVLISWILTQYPRHSVFYINNLKPKFMGLLSKDFEPKEYVENFNQKVLSCAISSSKGLRKFGSAVVAQSIATKQQYIDWLEKGVVKPGSCLIVSFENKSSHRMNALLKWFSNSRKIYNVTVMRDIFNLFTSRICSEYAKKLHITSSYYLTDVETINFWWDNLRYSHDDASVCFNYNRFIGSMGYRYQLARQLDLNDPDCHVPENRFGLTGGSSFGGEAGRYSSYETRYKLFNFPLVRFALLQNRLRQVCQSTMGLQLDDQNAKSVDLAKNTKHWWNEELESINLANRFQKVDAAQRRFISTREFAWDFHQKVGQFHK